MNKENIWKYNNTLLRESVPVKKARRSLERELKDCGVEKNPRFASADATGKLTRCNYRIPLRGGKADKRFIDGLNILTRNFGNISYGCESGKYYYFYIDDDDTWNNYEKSYNDELDSYYSRIDSIDLSKCKPSDKMIDKVQDYRDKGAKININAIKSEEKLLGYFWAACVLGWKALKSEIHSLYTSCDYWTGRFKWDYHKLVDNKEDAEDILISIERRAKEDSSKSDTRADFEKRYNLPNSNGRVTVADNSLWLPDTFMKRLINSGITVSIKKRTAGSSFDSNGRQWSEIEHLVFYPNTKKEFKYDIAVHTLESGGRTTYTGMGKFSTDERTGIKDVIDSINKTLESYGCEERL